MILKDVTHAVMEQGDFDALPEYSCSIPTGQSVGKQWKRGEPYMEPRTSWYLGEYVAHQDPKLIGIKWRIILLVLHPEAPKEGA